ncbi:MAG: transglycosylase domain-containing protein [Clostridia bacterium]|jgi:penicillin-binding protein 1A|nr:PBP1A family penicillin-binding protein [Clostridiales bacterium]
MTDKKKDKKKKKLSILRLTIIVFLLVAFIGAGAAAGIVAAYIKDAPDISQKDILQLRQSSIVYEEGTGEIVDRIHEEVNRTLVLLDDVPKYVQNAFIAIEDERFRQHFGIDLRRIIGVTIQNLKERRIVAGASTITQQLVRNVVLTQEQKFKRKIQEQYLAIKLERVFTKDQILEAYLNTIYFGHSAYGIHAASMTYFGKNPSELTLAEGAIIAGVTNNPGTYSPYLHEDNAKKRQELVLREMLDQGYISQQEYDSALREELEYVRGEVEEEEIAISSYFVDQVKVDVREALMEKFNYSKDEANNLLFNGGLKIYSTIDMKMQEIVEDAFRNPENFPETKEDAKGVPQPQAAMVIVDYKTGQVKAMVGGRGQEGKMLLNRATQSYRQPGSSIKPISVYTAAIDNGYTAATVIDDVPVAFIAGDGNLWIPKNWYSEGGRPTYWGLSTLREGVQWSMNVVTVKLLNELGIDIAFDYAEKMGLTSLVKTGPVMDRNLASMALGGLTKGVSPIDMATAYGTLANKGVKIKPITYVRVTDANGNVLLENEPLKTKVIDEGVAYIITDMLKSVVKAGTGTSANFNMAVAGKTGTTTDSVDAWFVGYTPYYVASLWMGNDEPSNMGFGGGSYPTRLWRKIMEEIHEDLPVIDFERPENVVTRTVDTKSGKLPTDLSYMDPRNTVRNELFIKGTEPTEYDDVHVVRDIDVTTNMLATPFCPPTLVESRVFVQRPIPYSSEEFLESIGGINPRVNLVPRDAIYDVPTEYCIAHNPFGIPPWGQNEENGDWHPGENGQWPSEEEQQPDEEAGEETSSSQMIENLLNQD